MTHNKILEAQIVQQASFSSDLLIDFLVHTNINLGSNVIPRFWKVAIMWLRMKGMMNLLRKRIPLLLMMWLMMILCMMLMRFRRTQTIFPKSFMPPLPCPWRMDKFTLDLQLGKFLEVLKKLYINIPFTDALPKMPSYAMFWKTLCLNKKPRRLQNSGIN